MNYVTGEWWRFTSLNATLTWVLEAGIILQAEGDVSISNIGNLSRGTFVQDTDQGDLYIKVLTNDDDVTDNAELVGTQT